MDRLILNCDLGEDEPLDYSERLLALVDAANIGCGVHAGNSAKTRDTIECALKADVLIGAHPGLSAGGGRGSLKTTPAEFHQLLKEQITGFQAAADAVGAKMHYIKLHGSLYHAVESDAALADTYLDYLQNWMPAAPAVFALAGGRFAQAAERRGLRVYHEAFADRAYHRDGSLVPRAEAHAVLGADEALERFRHWREQGTWPTCDGENIAIHADTLCVHGDSPGALDMIRALRKLIQ